MCNNKINYVECPEAIHMYIVIKLPGLGGAGSAVQAGLSLRLQVTGYNHLLGLAI